MPILARVSRVCTCSLDALVKVAGGRADRKPAKAVKDMIKTFVLAAPSDRRDPKRSCQQLPPPFQPWAARASGSI